VRYCQICGCDTQHENLYKVNSYQVAKCRECGIGRVMVDDFDPSKVYDESYFTGAHEEAYTDYLGSKKTIAREFAKTARFVHSVSPTSGTLFEVGCAYGFFLEQASKYYDVYGAEVVKKAVQYCHQQSLDGVHHGSVTHEVMEKVGEIDVCVMLDVIEHIDNVEEVFELICDKLRPGGSMVITTGDWDSLIAKLCGPRWRLMAPPFHLWYFTPSSLIRLGERFGLEMVDCSHPWKIVPIELIVKQAGSMAGLKNEITLPEGINKLGLPANLGDAMRIVLRKKDKIEN